MKLSVIIVLYNEFDQVKNCIRSVLSEKIKDIEIIIVDNKSEINGFNQLKKTYPKIQFIRNKNNLGFAQAANIGFKNAKGKFVLLLTPDTRIISNTINKTLDHIGSNDKVALVSCRIYSPTNRLQVSAFKEFPNLISHLYEYNIPFYKLSTLINSSYNPIAYPIYDHSRELTPKHMIGAYSLIQKSALEQVGFFDKSYYLYRMETDLCKKLYDRGWKIKYLPVGGLIHYGGSNWKKFSLTQCSPHYMRSTYLFFRKHYGFVYFLFAFTLGFISSLISLIFLIPIIITRAIQKKKSQSFQQFGCWVKILTWHVTEGLLFIFKK